MERDSIVNSSHDAHHSGSNTWLTTALAAVRKTNVVSFRRQHLDGKNGQKQQRREQQQQEPLSTLAK